MLAAAAVVFDVGEVLIDETRVWSTWAEVLGVSAFTLQAAIGAALLRGEQHPAGLDRVDPGWRAHTDEFERRLGGLRRDDLYPDALGALARLRAAGAVVAVAGNQPARRSAELAAAGVDVDLLVTSEELGADKPARAFFDAVVERLGLEPSACLYVGDRHDNDIGPAAAAGLRTCWLRRGPWALLQPPGTVRPDLVADDLATVVAAVTDGPGDGLGDRPGDGRARG